MKILVPSAIKSGYEKAEIGDSINVAYPNSKTRRGRVGKGVSQTLLTDSEICIVEPLTYDEQNGYLREDGIVRTLTTDGSSPKHNNRVVEPLVYDDFNGRVKADQSTIGTLTTNCGNDAPRNGVKIIEPIIDDTYGFEDKARIYEDCPTIRADRQGLKVAEPLSTRGSDIASTLRASMHKQGERNLVENLKNGRGYEGVLEPTIWGSLQEHCAVKQDGVCPTLTQAMGAGGGQIPMHNYDFRVRKLTEKECFRLQGVKDEDFAKIRKNQSKSSCYHLAGDSISSSVLMALFGEMLDIDWRTKVNDLVEELQDKENEE